MIKYGWIFIIAVAMLASCSQKPQSDNLTHNHEVGQSSFYTCSMHPQIREDKPGKCPICHMNLIKVEIDEDDSDQMSMEAETVVPEVEVWQCKDYPDIISDEKASCPIDGFPMILKAKKNKANEVVANIKLQKAQLDHFKPAYFPVTTMTMQKNVRLLGTVLQSEDKESNIPARVDGRVDKIYVKSTGSFIKVGDPVVDLYSPALISAGEEYLVAKKSYEQNGSPEFKNIFEQSQKRLELWGIKKFQYESWHAKGKVPSDITIYASSSGIVRKYNVSVGRYFKEGQNLFELSDLSEVWVEMDVYEQDAALVTIGQDVSMAFIAIPGEITHGVIDFVNPVLDPKSRTLKVRTTIKNTKGLLKPGMVADATLNVKLEGHPLVVPRSAIIDTGKRKVVWVKKGERSFQAKKIHTGHESQGYVEVTHGLVEDENVIIDGNFLLDAQAQLFGGYEDMEVQTSGPHHH